jgi:hypothetical protein
MSGWVKGCGTLAYRLAGRPLLAGCALTTLGLTLCVQRYTAVKGDMQDELVSRTGESQSNLKTSITHP